MQVTSMLSSGYLEPGRASLGEALARQRAQREAQAASTEATRAQAAEKLNEHQALANQEDDILAQEQELRAKLGTGVEVHTIYHYALGPDGRRYISGASVAMKGSEEDLSRVTNAIPTEAIQAKEDEQARRVAGAEDKSGSRASDDAGKDAASHNGAGLDAELSEEEKAQVRELQQTEREVIAHEAAHQAAAGQFGGGVSYSYTQGPDGKSYITGGEVPIQMKQGATPEETLRNMQQVQRAALAPADPSGQDRKVAARAAALAAKAQSEIASQKTQGSQADQEDQRAQGGGMTAEVARGTPVRQGKQEKDDPSMKGVSSLIASIREAQVQDQIRPAA